MNSVLRCSLACCRVSEEKSIACSPPMRMVTLFLFWAEEEKSSYEHCVTVGKSHQIEPAWKGESHYTPREGEQPSKVLLAEQGPKALAEGVGVPEEGKLAEGTSGGGPLRTEEEGFKPVGSGGWLGLTGGEDRELVDRAVNRGEVMKEEGDGFPP